MDSSYTICIIKPNKSSFSETFIQAHIDRLAGNKLVLYGGAFPVYDNEDKPLIKSGWGMLSYLVQKKIFRQQSIAVRTNALKNYLLDKKVTVVLAEYGMVGAMVTDACKLANIPLIIHFHGADAHQRQAVAIYNDFYQKAFKYASAIIAVSADMVESLKKIGASADKIILNPYGVDTSRFSVADVASSANNFLSVGRFVEKKAPALVVEAFNIALKKFPDARLKMVGTGPLLDRTKQLADKLNLADKIEFTGGLPNADIQQLLQQARCFVQHSVTARDGDMEGTPNTILEASSSGLPVVSTLHAGIKEAVVNGITGFLSPEYNIEAMAEGMIKLAGSPELAAKMGLAGREHIVKDYNIDTQIKSLDKVIQNCITNFNAGT
jgi:colanic acid/amylovoran biosynthesis glycosyltransferase